MIFKFILFSVNYCSLLPWCLSLNRSHWSLVSYYYTWAKREMCHTGQITGSTTQQFLNVIKISLKHLLLYTDSTTSWWITAECCYFHTDFNCNKCSKWNGSTHYKPQVSENCRYKSSITPCHGRYLHTQKLSLGKLNVIITLTRYDCWIKETTITWISFFIMWSNGKMNKDFAFPKMLVTKIQSSGRPTSAVELKK